MNFFLKYRSVFIVLIVALGLIYGVYTNAPEPHQTVVQAKIPAVPYVPVVERNQAIPIYSRGRVSASNVRQITSEVPGLVRYVSERLAVGADVIKGDVLVQIDEQPYILDVAQKQADLDLAKLERVRITAKAVVAQKGLNKSASEYARHIPQIRHANSQVQAAEAALSYAQKKLDNTSIKAPISGKVISLNITEGEFIKATSSIAKIYGTKAVEVRLPLSDQQLDILGLNTTERINKAVIKPKVSLSSYQNIDNQWFGSVARVEGERDMNQLLYVIAQVTNGERLNAERKPLLPGSFVEAKVEGRKINQLKIIPRNAEQASNVVWVIDENNQLRRKTIDVIYRGKEDVYIKENLDMNERIVMGSFHLMAEGLTVRPYQPTSSLLTNNAVVSASP